MYINTNIKSCFYTWKESAYALRILFKFIRRKQERGRAPRFIAGYAWRDRWHLLTFQWVYQFHSKTLRNLSARRVDMLIKPTRVVCTFSRNEADECHTHDRFLSRVFPGRLIRARRFFFRPITHYAVIIIYTVYDYNYLLGLKRFIETFVDTYFINIAPARQSK